LAWLLLPEDWLHCTPAIVSANSHDLAGADGCLTKAYLPCVFDLSHPQHFPVVTDLTAANETLRRRLQADMNRQHYRQGQSIAELWQDDQVALRPLPTASYEVCRTLTAVANRLGETTVDDGCYHVARALPGQPLFVKLYWDRLEVLDACGERQLATLPRTYLPRRERAIDRATELRPFLNKPRAAFPTKPPHGF